MRKINAIRKWLVLFVAILLPAAGLYYYYAFYSAENHALSVQCSFHALTGLQCPGCGGQRALSYLLHGDILKALRYNAFLVVGLPFFLYMYRLIVETYGLKKSRNLGGFFYSPLFAKIVLLALFLFFILRNIPVEPFTYLSPERY
ncbi:MAG: DUF2752 domain-containing protein [Prevotella sp.]|jgi:hypothetical protein|nr:DUF2752 domain-containing protein [Prevotella sp.]